MVFAIDFDNTISTHHYPFTGRLIPFAKEIINLLQDNGHTCFLWTVRGYDKINKYGYKDPNGVFDSLTFALEFCESHGIHFKYANQSPIHPSSSPKQLADYVIDDINIGCPLMMFLGYRVVDWLKVGEELVKIGAITQEQLDDLKKIKRHEGIKFVTQIRGGDIQYLRCMIGSDLVDEFISLGFIEIDENPIEGYWCITRLGDAYYKEFSVC